MLTQQLLKDGINKQLEGILKFSTDRVLKWEWSDTKYYVTQMFDNKTRIFEMIACNRYLLMR